MLWIVGFVVLLVAERAAAALARAGRRCREAFVTWFFVLNLGAVIAIVFGLLYYFVGQRNFFQERSETLLLNILPKEISEALKARAAHHRRRTTTPPASCSPMLSDFTPMAAAMTPLEPGRSAQRGLPRASTAWSRSYGLEKIKTIGDCYMVAAGVPRERADHASALAGLALDMQ